jgi:DNA-binding GntR family transcriptional regulator
MILSGQRQPGERISADEEAARIGISAIPVREALYALAARGLVDALPQRGFRVRPMDRTDFLETYQLRLLLEPFATKLAVPQLDEAALSAVDVAVARLARAVEEVDLAAYSVSSQAFHGAIYRSAGSRWLSNIVDMLGENSQRYERLATRLRGIPSDITLHLRVIANACRSREAVVASDLVFRQVDAIRLFTYEALDAAGILQA